MNTKLKYVIAGVGVVIVLLLTFQAGVMFGYHRANFGYRWSQNYGDNFFPRPTMGSGMMGGFNNRAELKGHGAFGEIVKVDDSSMVVKGRYEAEKTVTLDKNTVIESDGGEIKVSDLKVGETVFVIGTPNEAGQITAKVVRMLSNINNQK